MPRLIADHARELHANEKIFRASQLWRLYSEIKPNTLPIPARRITQNIDLKIFI